MADRIEPDKLAILHAAIANAARENFPVITLNAEDLEAIALELTKLREGAGYSEAAYVARLASVAAGILIQVGEELRHASPAEILKLAGDDVRPVNYHGVAVPIRAESEHGVKAEASKGKIPITYAGEFDLPTFSTAEALEKMRTHAEALWNGAGFDVPLNPTIPETFAEKVRRLASWDVSDTRDALRTRLAVIGSAAMAGTLERRIADIGSARVPTAYDLAYAARKPDAGTVHVYGVAAARAASDKDQAPHYKAPRMVEISQGDRALELLGELRMTIARGILQIEDPLEHHVNVQRFREVEALCGETAAKLKPLTHALKTWPEFYEQIRNETKRIEIRKDDRQFRVGDVLRLKEWSPERQEYTGRSSFRVITWIGRNLPGLEAGHVAMTIEKPTMPSRDFFVDGF